MLAKSVCYAVLKVAAIAVPSLAVAQQSGNLIIGEIAPLSGPAATVGTRLNQVAKMWAEEVNQRGGINGRKIELITCNDEGKPEKAVTCAKDLIDRGSVLLINDSLAPSIRATMPLVANGPVMIMPSPII
ncbi:MAG: branched-chain amino acid transporter, substrate-binding protein, partial [Noviherbaspirillum sp.]|nr:branched-chain amino acid transporter, substrate-binding protein [Noviherbaspirillum sp.]